MPGFSFTHDMHAFEGVDLIVDYRINGTSYSDGTHSFDTIEVLGRGTGLSGDGWRELHLHHPLRQAIARYLDTQDAADQAKRAIKADMDLDAVPRRPLYASYRHQEAAE